MEVGIESLPQSLDNPRPLVVQKKPRHRHTPAQLAALNELFEKTEHPSLEQRISLAEKLGMETKTVNAWFQNKRASSKKRSRNHKYNDVHSTGTALPPSEPSSTSSVTHIAESDDYHDDEISSIDMNKTHLGPDSSLQYHHHHQSTRHPGSGDAPQFITEPESRSGKMRIHTSHHQTDEAERKYEPHPSTELRQALSERLGMQHQTLTSWFQDQRNASKKKAHDDLGTDFSFQQDYVFEQGYPATQFHPSHPLASSSNGYLMQYHGTHMRTSVDVSLQAEELTSRRITSRRYSTPYSTSSIYSRPRRSRPEPYQLDALKELFTKTATPSIEERSALAAEIGMDVGRVTNWFRNLRQTARKRAKKTGSSEEDDDFSSIKGRDISTGPFSRPTTPSQHSTSSANDEGMDLDDCDHEQHHSDPGSDDEYQEAITPSPEPINHSAATSKTDLLSYPGLDKLSLTQYHGVKIEDALLLLSFHQHVMQ